MANKKQTPARQKAQLEFEQIWINGLDTKGIKALQKAVAANYFGYEVSHIIEEVARLHMQLWLGREGDKCFVILTKLTTHPGGKELALWSVGGEGYVRHLEQVYQKLLMFARKEDCRWMTGFVDRKGFGRLYERFNVKKYGLWCKEITDV